MDAIELIEKIQTWSKDDIVQPRLDNDEKGREWVYKAIGYDQELGLTAYQDFFDRDEQNQEYVDRRKETNIPSRKPYSWYQTEVNFIYSFHKCFASRNFTRLQYYRNDMSQKAKHNLTAINQTAGKFLHLKEKAESSTKK